MVVSEDIKERNRRSARASREKSRKRMEGLVKRVEELENQIGECRAIIKHLNDTIIRYQEENEAMRAKLGKLKKITSTNEVPLPPLLLRRGTKRGYVGVPDAPVSSNKPSNAPAPRSNRSVPKAPSSQITAGASESATSAKGGTSNKFAFQFGSISPGFINGMQIPARTSSAPPNLDEQKHDQARHDPVSPIPSIPKQQQPRKDLGKLNQPSSGEPPVTHQAKRDSFQQQQVPAVPFGTPSPQVQSLQSHPLQPQGMIIASPNLDEQKHDQARHDPVSPIPSIPKQQQPRKDLGKLKQQVFVPSMQSHPLQPQGMIHQGPGLSFAPQIGHQLAPQLGNLPMGIAPQFAQQQGGKYGKAIKITHPDTHKELRLDKRTDAYMDGGSSGTKSHPSVTPQSQPISSFPPAHQINYYPMPSGTYNPNNIFFQPSVPLSTTQMTTSSELPSTQKWRSDDIDLTLKL